MEDDPKSRKKKKNLGPKTFWICRKILVSKKDFGLPSKVVYHQRSSSIKSHLPSKVVFHQRLSSIKGHHPSKVIFHQKSSSIKGRLPFCCIKCVVQCSSMYLYRLLLSTPLYKLTITGRQTGRQAEKATYRGTSSWSAQK